MTNIHKLLDEMNGLELEINDKAKDIRLKIVCELLAYHNINEEIEAAYIIKSATKLAHFVEHGDQRSDYERIALPHATKGEVWPDVASGLVVKPHKVKKPAVKTKAKPKRKYTKRSKFWGKK